MVLSRQGEAGYTYPATATDAKDAFDTVSLMRKLGFNLPNVEGKLIIINRNTGETELVAELKPEKKA